MDIEVRRARPDEWRQLRALRLRALADAPSAFWETLAEAQARPEAEWHERAQETLDRVTFVAERVGAWLGMATGLAHPSDATASRLVGMFVDATARGSGASGALVEAVCDWARARGSERIYLWVNVENGPALALYRRCGFKPTGEEQPIPHTPGLMEMRMVRWL